MKKPSTSRDKRYPDSRHKDSGWRKSHSTHLHRFKEAQGKTVEFVEMCTASDFPCVEIGFQDKTALFFLFTIDAELIVETDYSFWKAGQQRFLKRWPAIRTGE